MLAPIPFDRTLTWQTAQAMACSQVTCFREDAAAVTLQVTSVTEQPGTNGYKCFFVRFKGPSSPFLTQRTYGMRHAVVGDFSVFITAVGQSEDGFEYEACFNHAQ